MDWTLEAIEHLLANPIRTTLAVNPDQAIEAFARAERLLGPRWIPSATANQRGIAPATYVLATGMALRAIEDIPGSSRLIQELKRDKPGTRAVLNSVHLLRSRYPPAEVEWEPPLGKRKADFRIRMPAREWVTAEVCSPEQSLHLKALYRHAKALSDKLRPEIREGAVDIYLRRCPSIYEIESIIGAVRAALAATPPTETTLNDNLGVVLTDDQRRHIGHRIPAQMCETHMPGITTFAATGSREEICRIGVFIAFEDRRVLRFLNDKAKQLNPAEAGLLMLQTSDVAGGVPMWSASAERYFKAGAHPLVSGVCLFEPMSIAVAGRYRPAIQAALVANENANFKLPDWIATAISAVQDEFNQADFLNH